MRVNVFMSKNVSMCMAESIDISLIARLNKNLIMNIKVSISLNENFEFKYE